MNEESAKGIGGMVLSVRFSTGGNSSMATTKVIRERNLFTARNATNGNRNYEINFISLSSEDRAGKRTIVGFVLKFSFSFNSHKYLTSAFNKSRAVVAK